ncbi:SDR family NAD(P)-dependent oxidoreductase [Vibrio splendidus]|jgi:NAD(P)-dependent dehydrogenase (short-subunit alcohol dehydrogenase family)|uniref:SDR family NAD(P)-dependent oxidoreductase n=1 Tax=Vibrio splendidus TaxID=29497 RepID=UPI000C852EC4|nr:SDR family NAD(P)-dependent oxidoreductase [Vibrio splendidus]MCQ8866988.1 SDR family NAD(P)-dependent oxidoreductase [Vibrio splendidus]PTP88197.1 short-chain dehydrogenase [Vibrio splendidus]
MMNQFGYTHLTEADEITKNHTLQGKRVVITGATAGLGLESAKHLSSIGAEVVMLGRTDTSLNEALSAVKKFTPNAELMPMTVDLSSLDSIREFANKFNNKYQHIDILINNAGVMALPEKTLTKDGIEAQFGINHLGHFLLTNLLWDALLNGSKPRVVTLSSAGHSISDVSIDDYNYETSIYEAWEAYGRSKSANALFAYELAKRAKSKGVVSISLHPGNVGETQLARNMNDDVGSAWMKLVKQHAENYEIPEENFWINKAKTLSQGVATQLFSALDDRLEAHNGKYLSDCGLTVLGENPHANGYQAHIYDDKNAKKLWKLSETLTKQKFEV